MSSSNCCFLTCIQVSQEAGQVAWYSHLLKNFPVCCDPHKGFGIVNKAEVDVSLELSCFYNDPVNVGNLISGSSAFSKNSLNIWKFSVHLLLKAGLENFEYYFASMWDKCNGEVVWTFFDIAFLWDWYENTFSSPVATAEFSKFAGILSVVLPQKHLLECEIAQLEFHHPHYLCSWCIGEKKKRKISIKMGLLKMRNPSKDPALVPGLASSSILLTTYLPFHLSTSEPASSSQWVTQVCSNFG